MAIVDLIFAFINFGVVVAIIVHFFRKRGYERLRQAMSFEQVHTLNLTKRNEQLKKQEQNLVRAYYHQNMVYEELSKKVDLWRNRREQERVARATDLEQAYTIIEQREQERSNRTHEQELLRTLKQEALIQAEQELTAWFRDPKNVNDYTQRGIAALKKDIV